MNWYFMYTFFIITDILNTVAAITMHLKITFPTSHHAQQRNTITQHPTYQ